MLSVRITRNCLSYGKLAIAVVIALAFCVDESSTTYAKNKKARYGTIKILSTPGGLPLTVDGKPLGQTTTDYRAIDLDPGSHILVVTLPNGQIWTREIGLPAGRVKCITLNYKPVIPSIAKAPCPVPLISLSVPGQVLEGEVVSYFADVAYSGNSPLVYMWTVSPANARILSGPGTAKISVDSTGLAGQRIVAKLVVDDGSGDSACRQSAQATTFVPPLPARESPAKEFDVCCSCSFDDQKARLDNLAVELQNDPSTTSYIIAYGGRTSRLGEAERLGVRARDYLVTRRRIDQSRLFVINGGFREENCIEFWIVPSGTQPPKPTPTLHSADVRPALELSPRARKRS